METPQIALLIAGNNQSNGGYSVIYSLGTPPFSLQALSYGGRLDANSYYFTVRTTEAFTLYTLVQNHVKSYGAVRAGFLKMGLSIPRGYRLSGGASPHDVLMAVREQFLATCMEEVLGEKDTYTYKAEMAPAESFAELLNRYALEPSTAPQPTMTGTNAALLVMPETEMRAFFDEVHADAFTSYYEVVIAATGSPVGASANLPATVAVTYPEAPCPPSSDVPTQAGSIEASDAALASRGFNSDAATSALATNVQPKQHDFFATTSRRVAVLAAVALVSLLIGFIIGLSVGKSSESEAREPQDSIDAPHTDSVKVKAQSRDEETADPQDDKAEEADEILEEQKEETAEKPKAADKSADKAEQKANKAEQKTDKAEQKADKATQKSKIGSNFIESLKGAKGQSR